MLNGDLPVLESETRRTGGAAEKPLVSVIAPAYNEAAILEPNLQTLTAYLDTLRDDFDWEVIIVNDGSSDGTAEIAERFAQNHENVRVIHHRGNRGLGQGFRTGFKNARGDYVVTIDIDLSYSPDHIGALLTKICESNADMVLASPYMKNGGRVSNVPWHRRKLSLWANRVLSLFAHGRLSTLTCMVRAYDRKFVDSLDINANGMDVMPEMIYKTMILRGKIVEIPAHLDWALQVSAGESRRSSMRILKHVMSTVISGLFFRPFVFFVVPGLLLLVFSLYVNGWILAHVLENFWLLTNYPSLSERASAAVAQAYSQSPHTFNIGLLSFMLTVQMVSLGVISLQNKRYFEQAFHQGATTYRLLTESNEREVLNSLKGNQS